MKIFSSSRVRQLVLLTLFMQTTALFAYDNTGQTVPKPNFQLGDTPSKPYADRSTEAQKFVNFYNKTFFKDKAQIPVLSKKDVVWFPPQLVGDTSLELVGRLTPNEAALLTPQEIAGMCNNPGNYPILCEQGFTSGAFCQACHDNVLFVEGGGLQQMTYFSEPDMTQNHQTWLANWSQYGDWSSNIMRLATRDPIWQAQIETETNVHPFADPAVIQDVCFSCHGEMGERQLKLDLDTEQKFCTDVFYATIPGVLSDKEQGKPYPFMGDCEPIAGKPISEHQALYAKYGSLARDGVSCEACHRIGPDKGEPGQWNGTDFEVFYGATDTYNVAERQTENPVPLPYEFTATFQYDMDNILTPDPLAKLDAQPMNDDDNLRIAQAFNKKSGVSYLRQSVLCGSCHVLIVPQIPTAFKPGAPLPDTSDELKKQFPKYLRPNACKSETKTFASATNGIYGDPVLDNCVALGYEQTTYLEWINSSFASEDDNANTCQGCHMPYVTKPSDLNDHTAIMSQSTDGLEPKIYRRHRLMGINLPVFEMFLQFPEVLGVATLDSQVPPEGTSSPSSGPGQTADFIQNYLLNGQMAIVEQATSQANGNGLTGSSTTPDSAATDISIDSLSINSDSLLAKLTITNNTGHKFPSGAGFRRAFLKFEVLNENAEVIWVSGQTNPYGAICDGPCVENSDGTYNLVMSEVTGGDPAKLQPHFATISKQSQVQVYEIQDVDDTEMLTSSTLALFYAAKDNRILPKGFKSAKELGCVNNPKSGKKIFGILQCSAAYATKAQLEPLTKNSAITTDKHYIDSAYAGSDAIMYNIAVADMSGTPASVRVTMEYQTIPPAFLAARFNQGFDQESQSYLTATERSIYLTSHLNTNLDLKSEHPDNPDLTFSSNWTTSIYQTQATPDEVLPPLSKNKLIVGNITWKNNSQETLKVSWIAENGSEVALGTIAAGAQNVWGPAYFVGVNVVRDESGNIVLVYVINGNMNQSVTISENAVVAAKRNKVKGYLELRSFPGTAAVSNFPVHNNSSLTLNLNWIQQDGSTKLIGRLEADGNTEVGPVYFGGTFTLTNDNGEIVSVYVATEAAGQTMTVNDAIINFWN